MESSSPRSFATTKVVVATTVALSFISFWRGASIVLADLASSMFYAGGIAAIAIGPAAPWFVLGVMLFSFAVRSVYMESCSMFVRGGVYIVVKDSMGPFVARLSVSSLVFDYVLTGPISIVSRTISGEPSERDLRVVARALPHRHKHLRGFFWSRFSRCISGAPISRACTSPVARRCASCKSPP